MPGRPIASDTTPRSDFFALAGHPVRWSLLSELARSDRQVDELVAATGRPQPLVSYHLGLLRRAGLVTSRRSSHDGRASYYRLDLDVCGRALSVSAASLHPGLATVPATASAPVQSTSPSGRRPLVLFACTGNGARSQIAEALLQHVAGDRIDAISGGSHPKPIHRDAVRVLAARGIDISDRCSKPLSQFEGVHVDLVVTLCDKVREVCPEFPTSRARIHWSLPDPSTLTDRPTTAVFRELADEIGTRVRYLVADIDRRTEEESTHDRRHDRRHTSRPASARPRA